METSSKRSTYKVELAKTNAMQAFTLIHTRLASLVIQPVLLALLQETLHAALVLLGTSLCGLVSLVVLAVILANMEIQPLTCVCFAITPAQHALVLDQMLVLSALQGTCTASLFAFHSALRDSSS